MRHCNKCDKDKPLCDFGWRNRTIGTRQSVCKECRKSEIRQHYADNKEYYKLKASKRNVRNRKFLLGKIVDYFKEHPCIDCGERDYVVLQFDHVRDIKRGAVSTMMAASFSWATIQKEIAKCDVRCANCHMRKTAKDLKWYSCLETG